MNEKYAHKDDKGRKQTIKKHLEKTAELAEKNAIDVFKSAAYAVGLAHDIGKYADAFQERLMVEKVDMSILPVVRSSIES